MRFYSIFQKFIFIVSSYQIPNRFQNFVEIEIWFEEDHQKHFQTTVDHQRQNQVHKKRAFEI